MLILTHLIWGCVLKFTSCLAPMNSIAWTFPPQSCALERDFWYLIIDCIKVKYLPPLLPTHSKTFWELDIVCVAPSTVQRLARCHINSILIISKHYHPGNWYSFLVSLSLYCKLPVCLHCWKKEHQTMNYASQAVWPHSAAAASSDPCLF